MCRNLTELLHVRKNFSPQFHSQLAQTLARILVRDKPELTAMNMTDDVLSDLESLLSSVLQAHPTIVPELQSIARESKSPARLDAIMSSVPK